MCHSQSCTEANHLITAIATLDHNATIYYTRAQQACMITVFVDKNKRDGFPVHVGSIWGSRCDQHQSQGVQMISIKGLRCDQHESHRVSVWHPRRFVSTWSLRMIDNDVKFLVCHVLVLRMLPCTWEGVRAKSCAARCVPVHRWHTR